MFFKMEKGNAYEDKMEILDYISPAEILDKSAAPSGEDEDQLDLLSKSMFLEIQTEVTRQSDASKLRLKEINEDITRLQTLINKYEPPGTLNLRLHTEKLKTCQLMEKFNAFEKQVANMSLEVDNLKNAKVKVFTGRNPEIAAIKESISSYEEQLQNIYAEIEGARRECGKVRGYIVHAERDVLVFSDMVAKAKQDLETKTQELMNESALAQIELERAKYALEESREEFSKEKCKSNAQLELQEIKIDSLIKEIGMEEEKIRHLESLVKK